MTETPWPSDAEIARLDEIKRKVEANAERRNRAFECLYERSMAFAPLWCEWASKGSDDNSELATRVRCAREAMAGAAVELWHAKQAAMALPS